ncbi:hypothetical protein TIFTF001_044205 [Ficus carica]|nr:hypothetical protein TIFTF001_044205 [Ficus carica]
MKENQSPNKARRTPLGLEGLRMEKQHSEAVQHSRPVMQCMNVPPLFFCRGVILFCSVNLMQSDIDAFKDGARRQDQAGETTEEWGFRRSLKITRFNYINY